MTAREKKQMKRELDLLEASLEISRVICEVIKKYKVTETELIYLYAEPLYRSSVRAAGLSRKHP